MTKAVFVTQQIDPAHPNLGAATGLVRALAGRVDEVVVLALHTVPGVLPANCRVREFGASSQALRGARFESALVRELAPRPNIVIAHMSPIYAVLAAPVCRPLGIPVVLWFTHWRSSPILRAAERVSTAVATVDPSSFPFASRKVRAIGHGIDVSALPCRPDPGKLHLLALGRTSPAKGLEAVIDGVRRAQAAGLDVQLEIRGPSETDEERAYRARLAELAGNGVTIEEAVPHSELPQVFARADLLVNAAAEGSLDKSVFEACASCVPVLASNSGFGFAGLLPPELLFARGDAADIAEKIASFAARTDRAALGHELRARVERSHSTASWADAILALGR